MTSVSLDKKNETNNNYFLENIETERLKFISEIRKKDNIVFIIIFAISFLFLIIHFFVQNLLIFVISLLFLMSLLLSIFFYFRKKKMRKENFYLSVFFNNLNSFIFDNSKNIVFKVNTSSYEEDKKLFFDSNIFNNIFYFKNQNSISFKINNFDIKLFDCVAQKETLKKLEYLFVGKFLVIPNNYQFDNEIIICLFNKNKKNSNFYFNNPNFIKILDKKNADVFAKNTKNIPNYLIDKIINIFVLNEILKRVIISIKKDKIYFCLNYVSNCLLNPPLKQELNIEPIIKFKTDLQKIIDNLLDK